MSFIQFLLSIACKGKGVWNRKAKFTHTYQILRRDHHLHTCFETLVTCVFSHLFLASQARSLSILLIFFKKQVLVLLILSTVFLFKMFSDLYSNIYYFFSPFFFCLH